MGTVQKKNKIFLLLSVADLIWSICAWIFDWPKIITMPKYLLPFILICPIYPLLLSVTWLQIYKLKKINLLIYYLGVLGSVVYGAGAVLYYPIYMSIGGFDWFAFGGIFWVLFYALQAVYLLIKYRPELQITSFSIAVVLVGAKLCLDFITKTSGYILETGFPQEYVTTIFIVMSLVFAITVGRLMSKA